jgi:hypothetical protein
MAPCCVAASLVIKAQVGVRRHGGMSASSSVKRDRWQLGIDQEPVSEEDFPEPVPKGNE